MRRPTCVKSAWFFWLYSFRSVTNRFNLHVQVLCVDSSLCWNSVLAFSLLKRLRFNSSIYLSYACLLMAEFKSSSFANSFLFRSSSSL